MSSNATVLADAVPTACLRQHGAVFVAVGHAEAEPAGRTGTRFSCALLRLGPTPATPGTLHRKCQTLSVVPRRLCVGQSGSGRCR